MKLKFFAIGALLLILFFSLKIAVKAQDSCPLKSVGDANCDGNVNQDDFILWKCEFLGNGSCPGQGPEGNLSANFNRNQDNKVDLIDFEIWRRKNIAPAPLTTSHIVFTSIREALKFNVFIMNSDGTEQTQLTDNGGNNIAPSLSKNGKKIVYISDFEENPDIYILNIADSDNHKITFTSDESEDNPSFSPDGTKIIYTSDPNDKREIYVMAVDGSNKKKLPNLNGNGYDPVFSPDGRYIAFSSQIGGQSEIYVMNADGSNIRRLTNNAINDQTPSFSPDGTKIVFSSTPALLNERLNIMNTDGTDQHILTNKDNLYGFLPSFSPDGKKIVFNSVSGVNVDVYTMDLDGNNIKKLTEEPSVELLGGPASWR